MNKTRLKMLILSLLVGPLFPVGSSGLLHAQSADNYRSRLRDAHVKVGETNLPIVFINVGGKMILQTKTPWSRLDRSTVPPCHRNRSA